MTSYRTSVAWEGLPEPVQVVVAAGRRCRSTEVSAGGCGDWRRSDALLAAAGSWMDLQPGAAAAGAYRR